jgi:hypothetical protein
MQSKLVTNEVLVLDLIEVATAFLSGGPSDVAPLRFHWRIDVALLTANSWTSYRPAGLAPRS